MDTLGIIVTGILICFVFVVIFDLVTNKDPDRFSGNNLQPFKGSKNLLPPKTLGNVPQAERVARLQRVHGRVWDRYIEEDEKAWMGLMRPEEWKIVTVPGISKSLVRQALQDDGACIKTRTGLYAIRKYYDGTVRLELIEGRPAVKPRPIVYPRKRRRLCK